MKQSDETIRRNHQPKYLRNYVAGRAIGCQTSGVVGTLTGESKS